jgi:hypothetical protein
LTTPSWPQQGEDRNPEFRLAVTRLPGGAISEYDTQNGGRASGNPLKYLP